MSSIARFSSGSVYERMAGYCRAVADESYVHVSGTIGADPVSKIVPESAAAQTVNCLASIEAALQVAGSNLKQVVRSRIYMTSREDLAEIAEVLANTFGDYPPANTTIICSLPVDGAKVEVEVTALRFECGLS
jgi:enamine deaminase RidA (YjgF/YER057c/UK114 family)